MEAFDQVNIYEFFGVKNDPLFRKIDSLKKGEKRIIGPYEVSLNVHGIYEITNEDVHESFISGIKCYEYIHSKDKKRLYFC